MNAARSRWRRRLVGAFTERLGLKALAVAFAVVLWFIATSKEPTEEIVPVRLSVMLDSATVLRDPPPDVRALVAGEGKEIFALFSSPPVIRRTMPRGADSATLVLTPDDVQLPPGAAVLVRDVQPRVVVVHVVPRPAAPASVGGSARQPTGQRKPT
ncbi:MAG: hypothetical protein WBQ26_03605 [Gemmatimonadaceae bacterium]|nr:hypothetical protein [Gemmatimonadaceae bacterium]